MSSSPKLHFGSCSYHHFLNVAVGTVYELSCHLTRCNYLLHYSTNASSSSAGRQAGHLLSCVTGVAALGNKVFLYLVSFAVSVPACFVPDNGLESVVRR